MDEKIAHLGYIQGVVNRMGNNSFLVKGWAIALTAAILAVSISNVDAKLICVALFSVLIFWWLDSYYLRQEKVYRKFYDRIADDSVSVSPFSMNANVVGDEVASVMRVAITKTVFPFYFPMFSLLLIFVIKLSFNFELGFYKWLCQAT